MSDLELRLLNYASDWRVRAASRDIVLEAIKYIEELAAENAELKAALGQPVPLSAWQKMEQQIAELAAQNEALRSALERIANLDYAFVSSGKDAESYACNALSLTATDALREHDAALLRNQWRPIAELPTKGEMFIWAKPKGSRKFGLGLGYYNVSGGWSDAYGGLTEGATHWMPLPEAPRMAEAVEKGEKTL